MATRVWLLMACAVLVLNGCQDDSTPAAARSDASENVSTSASAETPAPVLAYQADGAVWTLTPGAARHPAAPDVDGDQQHPDWSPDGSRLAFETNFEVVWSVGVDAHDAIQLLVCDDPCAAVEDPAWSPDGTRVAFLHVVGDGVHTVSAQLLAVDVQTGDREVIYEDTSGTVWLYQPRWSPDGTSLVFEEDQFASNLLSEDRTLRSDLVIVDTATGVARQIPGTRGAMTPDWSPDGQLIVYQRAGNLYTVAPDGTRRTRLTTYEMSSQRALQPTFIPDGKGVVFTLADGAVDQGVVTTSAVVALEDHTVSKIAQSEGATHPRLSPAP